MKTSSEPLNYVCYPVIYAWFHFLISCAQAGNSCRWQLISAVFNISVLLQSQAPSTEAPQYNDQAGTGSLRTPINCNAAIVLCCADPKSPQLCFNGYGCGIVYENGNACSQASVQKAVESIQETFSPVQWVLVTKLYEMSLLISKCVL